MKPVPLKEYQERIIEAIRLADLLDESHRRESQMVIFIQLFKNRYPNHYLDIVTEFERRDIIQ